MPDLQTWTDIGRSENVDSTGAVQGELERIIGSLAFETSERNRRFLRHVVEETLAGRADRIKGYSVATAVFERDDDFDPQLDPIVRIEAGRLRRALQHYYLTAGRHDPVRILIPKGSYVPTFEQVGPTTNPAPTAGSPPIDSKVEPRSGRTRRRSVWLQRRRPKAALASVVVLLAAVAGVTAIWLGTSDPSKRPAVVSRGPALIVTPFESSGSDPARHPDLGRGLTREVVVALTRFTEISVYVAEPTASRDDPHRRLQDIGADYSLTGSIAVSADRLRVTVLLGDARTGQQLWSRSIEADATGSDLARVELETAGRIARELAEPYGVVFSQQAKQIAEKSSRSLSSYECVLRYDLFRRQLDLQQLGPVRECLERAVKATPNDADPQAALALAILDPQSVGGAKTSSAERQKLLDRSQQLANRAVELAPESVRGYQALNHVYWERGDLGRSFAAGEKARALNPNDSVVLAELGAHYAMRGLWENGAPLLETAYARNPALPSGWRLMLALDRYVHGRYDAALAEAEISDTRAYPWNYAIRAMAYGRLGNKPEAEAAISRMLEIAPNFRDDAVADLELRHFDPALVRAMVEGLTDAGLDLHTR